MKTYYNVKVSDLGLEFSLEFIVEMHNFWKKQFFYCIYCYECEFHHQRNGTTTQKR